MADFPIVDLTDEPDLDPRVESVLRRWEAAINLCYPDEMTPTAKRIMTNIIADERRRD